MSKHTPGPWVWIDNPSGPWPTLIGPAGDSWIAMSSDPNSANARLIAAAPDLLDAVSNCLHDLEDVMPEYEPSGDRTHPGWVSIKEACEALTKATGELVEPISPDDDDEDED